MTTPEKVYTQTIFARILTQAEQAEQELNQIEDEFHTLAVVFELEYSQTFHEVLASMRSNLEAIAQQATEQIGERK